MSPLEARSNIQTNRVRLFAVDKLTKETADEKWDRIKIICTQPFNKSLQYGLSFIKLHSIEKVETKKESRQSIGAFMLTDPNSDEESIRVGTFFNNLKKDFTAQKTDGNKEYHAESSKPSLTTKKEEAPIVPEVGFYQPKKKVKRQLEEQQIKINTKETNETKKQRKEEVASKDVNKEVKRNTNTDSKPQASKSEEPVDRKRIHRPFVKLLKDVKFVMSGYQNPQRSNLRDKMITLGAQYKTDWDDTCTHLICAFKNTPKYRAIKGIGIIVSEKWTEDCYKQKKKLSTPKYFLEKTSSDFPEEDEIWADEIIPNNSFNQKEMDHNLDKSNDLSDYEAETEDEDTDEEIKRVLAKHNESKKIKESAKQSEIEVFDEDTDIDEENQRQDTSKLELPTLPDYYSNKIFYLYGSMNEEQTKLIKRYIIGGNGNIEDYMTKEVNYVITQDIWDENFDNALVDNPNLQFVKPQWIFNCTRKQKFMPPQPYLVVSE